MISTPWQMRRVVPSVLCYGSLPEAYAEKLQELVDGQNWKKRIDG
jgi:hypothetical protein